MSLNAELRVDLQDSGIADENFLDASGATFVMGSQTEPDQGYYGHHIPPASASWRHVALALIERDHLFIPSVLRDQIAANSDSTLMLYVLETADDEPFVLGFFLTKVSGENEPQEFLGMSMVDEDSLPVLMRPLLQRLSDAGALTGELPASVRRPPETFVTNSRPEWLDCRS